MLSLVVEGGQCSIIWMYKIYLKSESFITCLQGQFVSVHAGESGL